MSQITGEIPYNSHESFKYFNFIKVKITAY
jgi:hypothetical protein